MNIDPDGNYSLSTAGNGAIQVGSGLLNFVGGVSGTQLGIYLSGAGIGVPIAIKSFNTGIKGGTEILSGFENITYRATMNKPFKDKSVDLLDKGLDALVEHTGNQNLRTAYDTVDSLLDIVMLYESIDNLSNGLDVNLKAGGGGYPEFYSLTNGRYVTQAHGISRVVKHNVRGLNAVRKLWDMSNNVPALLDLKLDTSSMNAVIKKYGGGGR
jgi:hypothetical protein